MNKGFTLIELLVVTSIILLLSAVVFANYRAGESQFALQRSAHKLAQDIRRAQEMAMSARWCEVCYPQRVPPGGIPPGYGIYLKQGDNYYLIYADTIPPDGNERYGERYGGGDTVVETIYFEKNVYIKNVSPASLSINFRPPDPKTKISGNGASGANSVTITLSLQNDQTKERRIIVNKAGLIYVE